jgi:hypothetical protein
MRLFGDKNTFGISYRPFEGDLTNYTFAHCHLILGGHFIGNENESCLLGNWLSSVENLQNHIKEYTGHLSHPLFSGLTDREIFELIFKSNQPVEDFDPAFAYLPTQPTNELWKMHCVRLDETVDAYLIVIIEAEGRLKFIWKGWRNPCPQDEIGKLFSICVDHDFFNSTVETCLKFLKFRDVR